uniref:Cilia- and flagella-associated protein 157 n=1 Tax=Angiostrongylus cantonensis TaxID=6313 RepID=A0A158PCI9_ANGCA
MYNERRMRVARLLEGLCYANETDTLPEGILSDRTVKEMDEYVTGPSSIVMNLKKTCRYCIMWNKTGFNHQKGVKTVAYSSAHKDIGLSFAQHRFAQATHFAQLKSALTVIDGYSTSKACNLKALSQTEALERVHFRGISNLRRSARSLRLAGASGQKRHKEVSQELATLQVRKFENDKWRKQHESQLMDLQSQDRGEPYQLRRAREIEEQLVSNLNRKIAALQKQLDNTNKVDVTVMRQMIRKVVRCDVQVEARAKLAQTGSVKLEKCQHLLEESEAAKERLVLDKKKLEQELGEAKIKLENACAASRKMEKRQRKFENQLAEERENVQMVETMATRERDAHAQKLRSREATILSLRNELKQLNDRSKRSTKRKEFALAEVKSLAQSRTRAEVAALEAEIRNLEKQNGVETRKRQEAMRQIRCDVRATQMLRQLDEKEGELRRERAKSTIQRQEIDDLTEVNDTLTRDNSRLR